MLAELAEGPFDSERHLFEVKWDGGRLIAFVDRGRVSLQSRRLLEVTYRYPDLVAALPAALKRRRVILDGEVVAFGDSGRPNFNLLQTREQQQSPFRIRVAAQRVPVTYLAFDVLQVGDKPLISRPLSERRRVLSYLLRPGSPQVAESQGVVGAGRAFFEAAVARGLEGVMAKRLDSPYLIGRRSGLWRKVKPRQSGVFYIMGYTPGEGWREALFGSLAVGEMSEGRVRYVARVGTGLTEEMLAHLLERLKPLETGEATRVAGRGGARLVRWVRPVLRCRVSFMERTGSGALRAPVFEGLVE
jgi:DNA ligase D-like protein (predicted ligase)